MGLSQLDASHRKNWEYPFVPQQKSWRWAFFFFLNSIIFRFCFDLEVTHRIQGESKIPFIVLLPIGQLFVLENYDICEDRLQNYSKSYVRANLESWWTISWRKELIKIISKNISTTIYSTALCKSSLTKNLLKKRKMNDFEEKKNSKGPKINHST